MSRFASLGFVMIVLLLSLMHAETIRGDVKLCSIFCDGLVLQQGKAVPIWGWANPDEKVAVSFAGQEKSAIADEDGNWKLSLDPLKASAESRTLTVRATNTLN